MAEFLAAPARAVRANPATRGIDPGRLLVLSVVLITLALLSLLLAMVSGLRTIELQLFCMALLTTLIGLTPLVVDQARAERQHTIIALLSIVIILYYAMPVFARYIPSSGLTKPGSYVTLISKRDVLNGQIVATAGLAALIVAYAIPVRRIIGRLIPRPRYEWTVPFTIIIAGAMLFSGWVVTLVGVLGMIPAEAGTGGIGTLASARLFAMVPLTLVWLRYRSPAAALLLLVFVPIDMTFGLFTSNKRSILMAPAVLLLTWSLERRRVPGVWILVGFVALVVIYPANEFYRKVVLDNRRVSTLEALKQPVGTVRRVLEYSTRAPFTEYVSTGIEAAGHRLDGIGATSVIIRDTPARVPYQNGRTLMYFFYSFVPRAIWRGKPIINIGQWVAENYGGIPNAQTWTAATQMGEYYLNFGVAGVIGGLGLLGFTLRLAQECLAARRTIPLLTGLMILVYYLVTRFESSVSAMYSNVVLALAPLILAHAVGRTLGLLDGGARQVHRARLAI